MKCPQNVESRLDIEDPSIVLLACELHDGPCQQLAAALYHLDSFRRLQSPDPDMAEREFDLGYDSLRRGAEYLRTLLHNLMPLQLQGITLAHSVENLIQESMVHGGIPTTFSCTPQDIELPSSLTTAVFRIIQEGLANIRRHSHSKAARLKIVLDRSVRIEIEDWGIGFDLANVSRRGCFGITGMRARASLLGGTMSITSQADKGTLLVIDLPLSSTDNG
jgi:signal transduction histidine kinase